MTLTFDLVTTVGGDQPSHKVLSSITIVQLIVTVTFQLNRGLLLGMANLHTTYGVPRPKHSSVIERKLFFTSQGHHDLDLWPSDIKINKGHLLVMTNLHTKYEVPTPKRSSVIERKQVWRTWPWPLWPCDLKINRGHFLVVTNLHTKYEVPWPKQKQFFSSLSLWPLSSRSLWPWL